LFDYLTWFFEFCSAITGIVLLFVDYCHLPYLSVSRHGHSNFNRSENLQEGLSLFNKKPRKGIEFLVKANKVGESAEDVASFLRNGTGLDKTMIGDYLGEKEDFALKVMHAYVDSFNFQGMNFDEAIREFLLGFRLPGEAQKIDRIMEKFAERYCKCNPKAFTSADTAYVLGYSVIMLNTDAHNSMVKNKVTYCLCYCHSPMFPQCRLLIMIFEPDHIGFKRGGISGGNSSILCGLLADV
jgi:hypothetical protein